jgi:hypothetical protein
VNQGSLCSAIPGLQHAYHVIHLNAFTAPLLTPATVATALEFSLSDATAVVGILTEMRRNAVAPTAQPAGSTINAATSAEAVATVEAAWLRAPR